MNTNPKKRSTILIAVGTGVFVVFTGFAAIVMRNTSNDTHAARSDTPITAAAPAAGSVKSGAVGAASFVIPADHQAMAVQVPFVQGLAGYAKAGDVVNVYGDYKNLPLNASPEDPVAKLVLQKVKVLAVTPGADGGNATYILSVSTSDAEAIQYLSSFQHIWLTLARDDQGLLPASKGFSIHNG